MKSFTKFAPYAVHHIYQRALDKGVIFYTVEDRLVYYSLAAVNAKKHGIIVSAGSVMFTHTHQSVRANSLKSLREYLHDTDTSFTRLYNHQYSRKGRLFSKPPGRSQKLSSKDKRSNIIYVYNNHVEKRLCKTALEERWSLIAYAESNHPFSEKLEMKTASSTLQKAIRLVDRRVKKSKPLEYADLKKILPNLDGKEYEQFIDYVIVRYAWIDYQSAISEFKNYDEMIIAINSTTGGEHNIREEHSNLPDTPFLELIEFSSKNGVLDDIYKMTPEEKADLILLAMKTTSASFHQLQSFFHEKFSII